MFIALGASDYQLKAAKHFLINEGEYQFALLYKIIICLQTSMLKGSLLMKLFRHFPSNFRMTIYLNLIAQTFAAILIMRTGSK